MPDKPYETRTHVPVPTGGNLPATLPQMATRTRSPKLGYALAAAAATLWALNGSLARFLLDDHMPPARLAELRSVCTFAAIAGALALTRPQLLRVRRQDISRLILLGVVGLAGVHAFYFA